jgi:tetratricopeptide (TPR) repeat protein
MKLICPVSGTENEDREDCKQCGTDLRPLIQLSEFPDRLFDEGKDSLEKGRLLEALERLSTAVSLCPDSPEIHWKLGEVLASIGQVQSALEHLDRALKLAPDHLEIQNTRMTVARSLAEVQAAPALEKARTRRLRLLLLCMPAGTFLLGILLSLATREMQRWSQPQPNWGRIVQDRLNSDPATRGFNLKVNETDGVIRIAGEVPSALYRELVFQMCRDVGARVDMGAILVTSPAPLGTYRIRPGDSWWAIARRKYGAAALWPEIEKANKAKEGVPLRLRPGEEVELPAVTISPR